MEVQGATEIQQRVAHLRALSPGGAIACDGDGTLWSGDVGEDLFHAFVQKGPIRPAAHAQLRADALEHGLDGSGTGCEVARRIYSAYLEHRFPEERVCELMAWGFAEWTREEVTMFARDVVGAGGLEARLHPEVIRMLEWARRETIEVFLVSASPRAVVEEAARRVGIEASHVLAATPLYVDGAMLAKVERPIPYGAGKVRAIRTAIGERVLYAAFGDNAFDVSMLCEAKIAVAVRPKDRLRARAGEVPGLLEIARE